MPKYIVVDYKHSEPFKCVQSAPLNQLQNAQRFAQGAIDFHTQEGNSQQVRFFTEHLNFINKRIKKLSRQNRTNGPVTQ